MNTTSLYATYLLKSVQNKYKCEVSSVTQARPNQPQTWNTFTTTHREGIIILMVLCSFCCDPGSSATSAVTKDPREQHGIVYYIMQQKLGKSLGKVYGEGLSIHIGHSDTLLVYLEVETNNLVAAGYTTEGFQYQLCLFSTYCGG